MDVVTSPYFLIYASTAVRDVPQAELLDLLAVSRTTNSAKAITGLLLYSPGQKELGTFVQYLEGARSDVQALYVRITRDSRHRNCTILGEGSTFRRRFSQWTMGFRDLSAIRPDEVPGYNPIFLRAWTLREILAQPDPIVQLLYSFAAV